ncbi:MAG: hypothetical protein ACLVCG_12065, partial [Alistipes finegoldii]
GTARCCLATTKIRAGESLREVLKILRYGFHSRVCSRCNITTVSGQKKAIGADWSGLERTSEPKRFTLLYIAAGLIIRATARIAKQVLVQTDTRIFNRVSAQRNERAADRIIIQLFVQI